SQKILILGSFIFIPIEMAGVSALCTSRGEEVKQSPFLSVREGDNSVINCTYTDSTSTYFYWYKQGPEGLQWLITILSNAEKKQDGRLSVWLNKTEKHLSLNISDTQPGDSAVYFCATSTHCFSGTCSLYPNL
uniref:T cell receptor alpha variable 5 n=1 Tax=Otolemur garnettii TaxID=30611 RepID=H0XJ97_OTOGA